MPIPSVDSNTERLSTKAKVYRTLKHWIIEGQLEPLEKISDIEIAEYFKVSRTPVREAIQLLENQKLVQSFPGKATIITEIETNNIEQWYLPMAALQKLAITLAIEKCTLTDIENLRKLNTKFIKQIQLPSNTFNTLIADKAFHQYILRLADNNYINDFCETLWLHVQRLEYRYFKDNSVLESAVIDHENMIKAFEEKNADAAALAMQNNWENTITQFKKLKK